MPRFRVTEGTHVEEDGRKYTKGQTVDSPHDLAATFRGKFTPVDVQHYHPDPRLAPISPNPMAAPGFIDDPNQRNVSAEPQSQGGAPPNRLPPATPTEGLGRGTGDGEAPSGADAAPNAAANAGNTATLPEGEDVTDRFPKAKEQDYRVYKRVNYAPDPGPFYLYDADDLSKPVGAGLKRADVEPAVEKAIKSE